MSREKDGDHQRESCVPPDVQQGPLGGNAYGGGVLPEKPPGPQPSGGSLSAPSWEEPWSATGPAAASGRSTVLAQPHMAQGYDIVLVARTRCLTAPWPKLTAAFDKACRQLGLAEEAEG